MAALALPRRECEDALKLTGGDVAAALAHQLGRLRLDVAAVDALVWEYATARCGRGRVWVLCLGLAVWFAVVFAVGLRPGGRVCVCVLCAVGLQLVCNTLCLCMCVHGHARQRIVG